MPLNQVRNKPEISTFDFISPRYKLLLAISHKGLGIFVLASAYLIDMVGILGVSVSQQMRRSQCGKVPFPHFFFPLLKEVISLVKEEN